MNRQRVVRGIAAFGIALAVRLIISGHPDEPFWHFREFLSIPGIVAQGVVGAVIYFSGGEPGSHVGGIANMVNFIWLFLIVWTILTLFTFATRIVTSRHAQDSD